MEFYFSIQKEAHMKTKNKSGKIRQQQKHTNRILGRILGEKNSPRDVIKGLGIPAFFRNFYSQIFCEDKGEGPLHDLVARHQEGNRSPWKLAREEENL